MHPTLKLAGKFLWNRKVDYQKTRRSGTAERWRLIQTRVQESASLLDVGCSSGLLTAYAAGFGFFAVGLDANWDVLTEARKKCRPYLNLAFMHFVVTPGTVALLPVCDIVLCLSIYHQWYVKFGREGADQILRTLGAKARQRMFFEPPSKQSKYGTHPPAFIDRDERSIVDYNREMLGSLFGKDNVEFLGATQASRSERFRYLFGIETGTGGTREVGSTHLSAASSLSE